MRQRLCSLQILFILASTLILAQTAKPPAVGSPGMAPKASAAAKTSASHAGLPPAVAVAMNSVSGDRIREHIRFLSHDLLEGRVPAPAAATSPPSTLPRSLLSWACSRPA